MAEAPKASFRVDLRLERFWTGGNVQFTTDGGKMFAMCDDKVKVMEVQTGQVSATIDGNGDVALCTALAPDNETLIISTRSLLLRLVNWKLNTTIRVFKSLQGPVVSMDVDATSTLLATGSADSSIKVWDIKQGYCTHQFRGSSGVVSVVRFRPQALQLISCAEDTRIRLWDLPTSRMLHVFESHVSVARGIDFALDGTYMVSGGRDNIANVWNLSSMALEKTIPVFESLEAVVVLPKMDAIPALKASKDKIMFLTAGDKGTLRVWGCPSGKCLHTVPLPPSLAPKPFLFASLLREAQEVAVLSFDGVVSFRALSALEETRQLVGNLDEVVDVRLVGPDDRHVALATNSAVIRVIDTQSMATHVLGGHTDTVLCLDASADRRFLVSCSKDNSVRVWYCGEQDPRYACVATAHGHTDPVAAVAIAPRRSQYIVSGGKDTTLKIWSLKPLESRGSREEEIKLSAGVTRKAHDSTINALAISPNDKLIASASQDRTVKLWDAEGTPLAILKGHRRGVWAVQFSPVDQVVASSSADSTIKLWALTDHSCIRTFEGHAASVLRIAFLTRGTQLLSTGADGLMKLWTIKSSECTLTLDAHTDKVWGLAVSKDGSRVVTGGADGMVSVWRDSTAEIKEETLEEEEKQVEMAQELSNFLLRKEYKEAIGLTLRLKQPFRLLNIFGNFTGEEQHALPAVVRSLSSDQLCELFTYLKAWNTNSRHSLVAQTVLHAIVTAYEPKELAAMADMAKTIEALVPYSARHFERYGRLQQHCAFIEYTWQTIKLTDLRPSASSTTATTSIATSSTTSHEESSASASIPPHSNGDKTVLGRKRKAGERAVRAGTTTTAPAASSSHDQPREHDNDSTLEHDVRSDLSPAVSLAPATQEPQPASEPTTLDVSEITPSRRTGATGQGHGKANNTMSKKKDSLGEETESPLRSSKRARKGKEAQEQEAEEEQEEKAKGAPAAQAGDQRSPLTPRGAGTKERKGKGGRASLTPAHGDGLSVSSTKTPLSASRAPKTISSSPHAIPSSSTLSPASSSAQKTKAPSPNALASASPSKKKRKSQGASHA